MFGVIYKISFPNTNKIYIGQTIHKDIRFRVHLHNLRNGLASQKLQDAYNTYGAPSFEVLLECDSREELNDAEDSALEVYNSVNYGFNSRNSSTSGGQNCFGDRNGNSKYTNETIIDIVYYVLENPLHTITKVAEYFQIPRVVIEEIVGGVKHKWLSREIPNDYDKLLSLIGTRSKAKTAKDRGIVYPLIKGPDGKVYTVDSLRGFAREHNLNNSSLGRVLNRKTKQHKGWTLSESS